MHSLEARELIIVLSIRAPHKRFARLRAFQHFQRQRILFYYFYCPASPSFGLLCHSNDNQS
ncbi:MAG: hypothetical protein LBF25_01915 [Puniceicoccales bacterium]|nr:hypothetical protein [Puniceicoccales bacterium]